jgi:hypothetical protein
MTLENIISKYKIESHRQIEIILNDVFNNRALRKHKLSEVDSSEDLNKFKLKEVISSIKEYQKWVQALKKDFSITKNYTLEHIAEQIFSESSFDRNICKMHILAIEFSINELLKELEKIFEQDNNISIYEHFIKGKLALLRDIILDINELIWKCKEVFLEEPQTRKSGRRRLFDSREVFLSSKNLLRRHFYYDDISFSSISVFLIRQSIELKILNCLGIYKIVNKNNIAQKFKIEKIIEFIEQSNKIYFPIKKSLLLKITKWTNAYIHRGIMHYHWQTESCSQGPWRGLQCAPPRRGQCSCRQRWRSRGRSRPAPQGSWRWRFSGSRPPRSSPP